jgi:drug/metabolite transporter (DMT)-like permease
MPGASAPSLTGFVLMAISGIAWGAYTLAGSGSKNPLIDTANNFLKTLPFIVLVTLLTLDNIQISNQGIALAIISGAVMSGLGYAIWYSALTKLTVTQAATMQLTVPIIATFGGVIFSNEVITIKLIAASILVLGGVLVVTLGKQYVENRHKNGTCKCRVFSSCKCKA